MASFTPQEIESFLREFFDVVGTRQYVGARYVPLFGRKGESSMYWNNSAPYEPLTVVLHLGDSYTSRTYVPAGIDISDDSYWAKTGDYNAQIEQYRRDTLGFDDRISQNTASIASLDGRVASNTASIASCTESIATETAARTSADSALESNFNRAITEAIGSIASSKPVFVPSVDQMTSTSNIYVLTTNGHIYTYVEGAWTDTGMVYTDVSNAIYLYERVTPTNMAQLLPDCNYAEVNTFYQLTGFSSTTPPLNTPMGESAILGGFATLLTLHGTGDIAMQVWISQYNVWTRQINTATHAQASVWHNILERVTENDLNISNSSQVEANSVLANFPASTVRFLSRGNGATYPTDTPYAIGTEYWDAAYNPAMVLSQTVYGASYFMQYFVDDRHVWRREVANTHTPNTDWYVVAGDRNIYVSKAQQKSLTFDSFTAACRFAWEHDWVENVMVLDGDYDLITEIEDIYGSMDGFAGTGGNNTGFIYKGLGLKNYNVIGCGNHTIRMNYTGNNAWVLENVSMFTILDSALAQSKPNNFRLEGLNLEGSRMRYLIHDDPTSNATVPYEQHHVVRGCILKWDNTNNPQWAARQIIGGGMGTSSLIEIQDNVFVQNSATGGVVCSYHNNRNETAQGRILVSGNYVTRGTFRFSWLGLSQRETVALCHDNSVTSAPLNTAESETAPYQNVVMYAWNNEIRS